MFDINNKEMQKKSTMRHYYTIIVTAKMKYCDNIKG